MVRLERLEFRGSLYGHPEEMEEDEIEGERSIVEDDFIIPRHFEVVGIEDDDDVIEEDSEVGKEDQVNEDNDDGGNHQSADRVGSACPNNREGAGGVLGMPNRKNYNSFKKSK